MKTRVLHTFALWSAAIAVSGTMFLQSGIVRAGEWVDAAWATNEFPSEYDKLQNVDDQRPQDPIKTIVGGDEDDLEAIASDVDATTAMPDKLLTDDTSVTEIDDGEDGG